MVMNPIVESVQKPPTKEPNVWLTGEFFNRCSYPLLKINPQTKLLFDHTIKGTKYVISRRIFRKHIENSASETWSTQTVFWGEQTLKSAETLCWWTNLRWRESVSVFLWTTKRLLGKTSTVSIARATIYKPWMAICNGSHNRSCRTTKKRVQNSKLDNNPPLPPVNNNPPIPQSRRSAGKKNRDNPGDSSHDPETLGWSPTTSWWFQPIWKILVKLDHFPK